MHNCCNSFLRGDVDEKFCIPVLETNDYNAFAKLVANDPGLLQKADQANLIIRLETPAMSTLLSIDMSIITCTMRSNADYEKD